MAASMEIMIITVLSSTVRCMWDLNESEEALLSTVAFIGMLIGAPFWGLTGDHFGRKKGLILVLLGTFVFGMASAFSPGYYWLLLFRGLIGFFVAGVSLCSAYCLEFQTIAVRAVIICMIMFAWSVGAVAVTVLGMVVMTSIPDDNWRWFLGLAAVPSLLCVGPFLVVPESPRYLLLHAKRQRAEKVLSRMAEMNCKRPLLGRLVKNYNSSYYGSTGLTESQRERAARDSTATGASGVHNRSIGCLSKCCHWMISLFSDGWWRTTLLLWCCWFGTSFLYYGASLLGTSFFQYDFYCALVHNYNESDVPHCYSLDKSDYTSILWTTSAEFPGAILITLMLLLISRKKCMLISIVCTVACVSLLYICTSRTVLTIFLFGVRCSATAWYHCIYLYTPEVYPTSIRGFGMSITYVFNCLAGMVSPFVAQPLLASRVYAGLGTYVGVGVLSAIATILLPIETMGQPLRDSGV